MCFALPGLPGPEGPPGLKGEKGVSGEHNQFPDLISASVKNSVLVHVVKSHSIFISSEFFKI